MIVALASRFAGRDSAVREWWHEQRFVAQEEELERISTIGWGALMLGNLVGGGTAGRGLG